MTEAEKLDGVEDQIYKLRKFRKHDESEPIPYYFRDGIRRIHYIIVLHDDAIYNKETLNKVLSYLDFMEFEGLEFEFELGLMDPKLLYLKVHATDTVINHFANLYDIDIFNAGHNFIDDKNRCHFRMTELTRHNGDVFKREGKPTSCEIILIVYKILSDPSIFNEKDIQGLDRMIKSGYIKDAYPLHDGVWQWTEARQQYLNDRQILSKYWANFAVWYKEQPINLVEKYFGTGVAFYFAWFEHYNNMILLIALYGTIIVVYNLTGLGKLGHSLVGEICSAPNDSFTCPMCGEHECAFIPTSNYCRTTTAEYVFTRRCSYFSLFITIFVSVIVKTWRRKEGELIVRWNVQYSVEEYKLRRDYMEKNPYTRNSKLTGKPQHYVPVYINLLRYSVLYFIVLLSICGITIGFLLLIAFKIWMTDHMDAEKEPERTIWSCVIYSVTQVFFITLFSFLYTGLSQWITYKEVPKTEKEYDDAIIYNIYLFGFMNNYLPVIFTTFVSDYVEIAGRDRCLPTGCGLTVAIQIITVVILKYYGRMIYRACYQCFKDSRFVSLQTRTVSDTKKYVPTWEKEYYLQKPDKMFLNLEFFELMIQFGYIGFFGGASPLAAIAAFLCNIIDLRLTAIRLLSKYRRPIPVMVKGIGSWNNIITLISYISVISNILILMLHSRFINSWVFASVHRHQPNDTGFLHFYFSRHAIRDLPIHQQHVAEHVAVNITECLAYGYRFPPEHERKYEKTETYYMILVSKFSFMLIAQNIIALIVAAMYFCFDDVPRRVNEQLHREKMFAKEMRLKMLDGQMQMNRSMKSDPSIRSKKSIL